MRSPLFYLLFPLAMYGLYKAFPFKKSADYTPPDYNQLAKFTFWGKMSGWVMLLFFGGLVYALVGPIYDYRMAALNPGNDAAFFIFPGRLIWGLVCWIPVLGYSVFVYNLLAKLYLGNDFRSFVDYSNKKSGYNVYKAAILICTPFAIAGTWLMICMWNYHIYGYRDKLVIHWFLAGSDKVYTYNQVKAIDFTAETKQQGDTYNVTFNDGQEWNTITGLSDDSAHRDMDFIAKQAGLRVYDQGTDAK